MRNGVMTDLNSLVPAGSPLYLFTACSINSLGEIIGIGLSGDGSFHSYLAAPAR
jgi:dihydroxyacid dehydratase/phosphogluconate dehydratase